MARWKLMLTTCMCGLVLVLASGCGSETNDESESLSDAAEATTAAGSSRVEVKASVEGLGDIVMRGSFDYADEEGALTIDAPDRVAALSGGVSGFPAELRFHGNALYARWTIDGKEYWTKETDFRSGDPMDVLFPSPGGSDPQDVLALIVSASGKVERLGSETVRGAETTHYRLEVDVEKLRAQLPRERRAQLDDDAAATLPIEVWTDDDRRVRKALVEERSRGEDQPAITTSYELFDFGIDVAVEAPSADEVISHERFDEITTTFTAEEAYELACEGAGRADRAHYCDDLERECGAPTAAGGAFERCRDAYVKKILGDDIRDE